MREITVRNVAVPTFKFCILKFILEYKITDYINDRSDFEEGTSMRLHETLWKVVWFKAWKEMGITAFSHHLVPMFKDSRFGINTEDRILS